MHLHLSSQEGWAELTPIQGTPLSFAAQVQPPSSLPLFSLGTCLSVALHLFGVLPPW